MSATFDSVRSTQDSIRIPTVWLAVAVSLLLHLVLLWGLPRAMLKELLNPAETDKMGNQSGSLAVRLAPPPPRPAPPPAAAAAPSPPPPKAAPARKAPPPRAAEVLTAPGASSRALPAPSKAPPPKPAPEAPAPAEAQRTPAQVQEDFAAMVEARRQARAASQPSPPRPPDAPQETEQERHSRQVAANLGLNRAPSFGTNKNAGGGIFQVVGLTPDEATVAFFGWNKMIRRNSMQTLNIRRGDNPNIELAVVRRMITLIRDTTTGDFTWESQRLGRDVELSARVADQQQLETFLMAEFFSPGVRPR